MRMQQSIAASVVLLLSAGSWAPSMIFAEDPPITRNVPIPEFQNSNEVKPYNFDAAPQGLFQSIQFAEGFEEELGYHRANDIVPVNPTEVFPPDAPVFMVFKLHQHLESFQVFGLCYPEHVAGLDPTKLIAQDVMLIALEDESGYVKLDAPSGGWKPGQYKVEVHVGWRVNEISLMGTMRFTVQPG
jgi:hypothetical protein